MSPLRLSCELLVNGNVGQMGAQIIGAAVCFVWAFGASFIFFKILGKGDEAPSQSRGGTRRPGHSGDGQPRLRPGQPPRDGLTFPVPHLRGGTTQFAYSDTWTWNGTAWTQLSPASHPSSRDGGAMAFDTATGTTILFGGLSATTGAALNDTWSWNGTNWTNLSVTGPSARYDANLVYDAAIGKLVLFGGYDGSSTFSETWTFDGTTWTKLAPAAHPTARANPAISYDPGAQRALLYGGDNGSGTSFYGDTWTFDGTTWTQQSPVHSPGQRSQSAMAFDPVLTKVILFGGRDSANVYYDSSLGRWTQRDPIGGSIANPSAMDRYV